MSLLHSTASSQTCDAAVGVFSYPLPLYNFPRPSSLLAVVGRLPSVCLSRSARSAVNKTPLSALVKDCKRRLFVTHGHSLGGSSLLRSVPTRHRTRSA
ncbi:hypothetical protein VTN00DRAFT_606 [Thermoascus crustaceus]|uniref:uncharacterized protein n=1 Tax=Thermoascus crustaceus TaxID=5088 RepID=UPI00374464FA